MTMTRLTNTGKSIEAAISPDGRMVAHVQLDKGADIPDLYRIPALGGTPRKLMSGVYQTVSFSPDGNRFAFLRSDPGSPRTSIMIANADGSGEKTLATKEVPLGFSENPSWSPDGRSITYVDTKDGVSNLWEQPLAGGPPRRITRFTEDQIPAFAWSRDGKRIALSRGDETSDVVLITDFR